MKQTKLKIFLFLNYFFSFQANTADFKNQGPFPQETSDPYKCIWEDHEGKTAGMKRFFLDLNGDGEKELFLGPNSLHGSGGGVFFIFQKSIKYRYLGEIFIDLNNFELSETNVNGFHTIKSFRKNGSNRGNLMFFQFKNNKFTNTKSELTQRKKVRELIKQTKIHTEDSGKSLKWTP